VSAHDVSESVEELKINGFEEFEPLTRTSASYFSRACMSLAWERVARAARVISIIFMFVGGVGIELRICTSK
jgi:hypothetical protein